ncbi:MaoC like domain protein [compost metagenome]
MFQGKWYDEVALGERFGTAVTVTETHLVLAAGMFGDFNPLHVDEAFAAKSRFGGRILLPNIALEADGRILVAARAG